MKYLALFEFVPGEEGFIVLFPDIPFGWTTGRNFDEAYKRAVEVLDIKLSDMEIEGQEIPSPRTLEQIQKEWEDWAEWEKDGNFLIVPVPYIPAAKPAKYSIYMDKSLMARIDEVTDNRSAFLSKAAEMLLDYHPAR